LKAATKIRETCEKTYFTPSSLIKATNSIVSVQAIRGCRNCQHMHLAIRKSQIASDYSAIHSGQTAIAYCAMKLRQITSNYLATKERQIVSNHFAMLVTSC
jgi:hypothetical protein